MDNNFTDETIFNLQKVINESTIPIPVKRLKFRTKSSFYII